ncbi:MAG: GntR family transcriptional regulator [Solirubrobacterales bacterium]|jgi:GntR family carbon starvation induced transcriptional regulator|nr:GntR family transcriptional regulator [Solirubrobacterales bacterium]
MEGTLRGDRPLRARDFAEQWSVSETPVREAFQRLAAEGFLVHTSHRGVRVAPISPDELAELYDLRVVLEPMALGRSLERADEEWLESLRTTFDRMQEIATTAPDDRAAYDAAHREWHYALISKAGNSWWPRTVRLLRDQCERYWVLSLEPRDIEEISREHERIQEASVACRVHEATRLLTDHIAASEAGVRAQLGI